MENHPPQTVTGNLPAEEQTIIVSAENSGTRLDAFLASQLTGISRSAIQRAIEGSEILVNERTVRASHKIRPGDQIQIELLAPEPLTALPEKIPLNIVHEDDAIIVLNKPAGMVVHPGAGVSSGTVASGLVWHLQQQPLSDSTDRQNTDPLRPGIVHRLDVGTSGLMVAAKHARAQLHLASQFAERTVRKSYLALVYGLVNNEPGRIEEPLGRDPRNRVKMAVRPRGQGRTALTFFQAKEHFDEFTLLEVEIKTGRTHQIRVHLAHLKHPVAGDETYDSGRGNSLKNARVRNALAKLKRPFLHAAFLSFTHPISEERLSFTAPLPEELQNFLAMLRNE